MADEADIAHEFEQLALSRALAFRKPEAGLVARGACYNCGRPLKAAMVEGQLQHVQIFCDRCCADDWEKRSSARSRQVG